MAIYIFQTVPCIRSGAMFHNFCMIRTFRAIIHRIGCYLFIIYKINKFSVRTFCTIFLGAHHHVQSYVNICAGGHNIISRYAELGGVFFGTRVSIQRHNPLPDIHPSIHTFRIICWVIKTIAANNHRLCA